MDWFAGTEKEIRAAAGKLTRKQLIDQTLKFVLEISSLKKQLEKINEKLGLNSTNSSKPPSSDGPDTPKEDKKKKRKKSDKKQGGQPGHAGHNRKLAPEEKVTHFVDVPPGACEGCGIHLVQTDDAPQRHQVWDLPEKLQMIITEYRLFVGYCPCCQKKSRADLPEGVTWSPFGARLRASVGIISGYFRLSDRMLQNFLQTFFEFTVSLGAIVSMRKAVSKSLAEPHAEAHEYVKKQPVIHADETGWKEKAKRYWLWAATTIWVTVFIVQSSRSAEAAKKLLGENFSGNLITDRCKSYQWVDERQRQYCWSHLLRDFQRIADRGKVPGRIGRRLKKLGGNLFQEWHRLQAKEISRPTFRTYASKIRSSMRETLDRGSRCRHPETAGTCRELLKNEKMMWTFVRKEGIAPTNNAAERAVRPAVIKRKLSYGTQSEEGSRFIERIMTAVTTLRQQPGRNVLDWLTEACEAHLRGKDAPSLLPNDACFGFTA